LINLPRSHMFTGIIEATGNIQNLEWVAGDVRAVITSDELDLSDVQVGDSICVSGVCLTAIEIKDKSFAVDISNETLALTSFAALEEGARVNLEKAMQPSSRFGGHIVSGHVDGLAELLLRKPDARSERLVFRAPENLKKYIAAKGSVCLEGISLTVNEVSDNQFGINIIPHTAEVTTFAELSEGDKVNLEVDLVSRYLERMLAVEKQEQGSGTLTFEKLAESGFTRKMDNK